MKRNFVAVHFYDQIEISCVNFFLNIDVPVLVASDVNTYFPLRKCIRMPLRDLVHVPEMTSWIIATNI